MDPFILFESWYSHWLTKAASIEFPEPTSFTLATATKSGVSSLRTLLLKSSNGGAFRFYTHSKSQKGLEILENPNVSLLFYWPHLARQVRINGRCELIPRNETIEYFQSRPRESQLGATVSRQSQPSPGVQDFARRIEEAFAFWKDREIECPETWNGYDVYPERYEFWQGHEFRFHERQVAERSKGGDWGWVYLDP